MWKSGILGGMSFVSAALSVASAAMAVGGNALWGYQGSEVLDVTEN